MIENLSAFTRRCFAHAAYRLRRINRYLLNLDPVRISCNGQVFFKYRFRCYPEFLNNGNAVENISDKALSFCKGYEFYGGCAESVISNQAAQNIEQPGLIYIWLYIKPSVPPVLS
jgi:hypothetical protein